jgi:hypothetical protein
MDSEELITAQAEAVYRALPGVPGYAPRVWAYRNTIKALNWYSSVRVKLDDPDYSSWFIKFKGFSDTPYPGGPKNGQAQNGTFHVPNCDWYERKRVAIHWGTYLLFPRCRYNNGTAPRCSGFYHDQEQTPEHPGKGLSKLINVRMVDFILCYYLGGGKWYPVDGACETQCDCGAVNPCGEYIFDHRGGTVHGRTFREWFIHEYMVTNETLLHVDPTTGRPQPIGLGWLDDSMTMNGPTEEDPNYIVRSIMPSCCLE